MADVKLPRTFKVGAKATQAARANRDPSFKAPETAKVTVDKKGNEYKRWVESGTIESAYREASGDGALVTHVVSFKPRAGEPNFGKLGFFRMTVHPDIVEGLPVDAETERKYSFMSERAMTALVALVDATGLTPKAADAGIGALLETLFPLAAHKNVGPLIGKTVAVKIQQRKNKPPYDEQRPYQEDAEMFLPAPALAAKVGLKK